MKFVDHVARQERKRRMVMICSSWPPTEKRQKTRRSLVCGTVTKPIGSNVAITKSRVLKRISKNDSVLHKHVKWLKKLQEERRRVEERKEVEQRQQQERKRQFMEREAKKRAKAKADHRPPEPPTGAPSNKPCVSDQDTDDSTVATAASTIASAATECSKRPKPAWCQSEAAHEETEELAAMEDEANLLDFANGLNFEEYTEDLELQTLLNKVQERIQTLKKETKKDETKLQTCIDSETAAERAEALDNGPVVDFVPADMANDEGGADDTQSIANSVLSQSTLGSVHSKKSLHALVAKAKQRIEMAPIDEEGDVAVPPPVFSTVTDDDGQRMRETRALNKLAFKNRNPAL